ncbi:MAG: response regulator [Chloroflexi bacterium]|nr:response regulator [Chloroflexota bacterium]
MKFLIIDDNPADRELIKLKLRRAFKDSEFKEVSRPSDLDEALSLKDFDLILTDYQLNWSDGLKIINKILDQLPDTPVLMVTDSGNEEVATAGLKSGLSDYVLKRQLQRLPVAVNESLERARLRRENEEAIQQLKLSEERYRVVSELISDYAYAFQVEADGTLKSEWVTQAFSRITGYTIEDTESSKEWFDLKLCHPEDIPIILHRRNQLFSNQACVTEARFVTKGGEIRWLRDYAYPLWDETQNRLVRIYGAGQDITERRQAEEELATEKERLAVTLQSIGDGVITTDISGKITLLNPVAERLTGWNQSEAIGRDLEEVFKIVNLKSEEPVVNPVQQVLAGGTITSPANRIVLISRNGSHHILNETAAPLRNMTRDLQTTGVVLVFRDITEQHKIEEELSRRQKLDSLGVLAGGIAHDFNNILTSVVGNLALARIDLPVNFSPEIERVKDLLLEAEKAAYRAKGLTQQLLTFSKGGVPIKKATDLRTVLEESVTFALRGSNVRCTLELPADLWPVEIDEGQIHQVINNLVINAIQAMPDGGTLTIRATNIFQPARVTPNSERPVTLSPPFKADIGYVMVILRDEGVGIPSQNLSRIFDPYFTTKQHGSGLGLAASFSIITKHDGFITVESEQGKGSSFFIYLPVSSDTEQYTLLKERAKEAQVQVATPKENFGVSGDTSATPPLEATTRRKFEPAKHNWLAGLGPILIVDDEAPIREVLKRALRKLGATVEAVENGEKAITHYIAAKSAGTPYQLLIMDLTIPGSLGGKEAMEQLRKIDPSIRAIVTSGYSSDPVMADYRAYGFSAALTKPFRLEDLYRVLEESNLLASP